MEIDPKFLKKAEELLPCLNPRRLCTEWHDERPAMHATGCPAVYRHAVALALQEERRAGESWGYADGLAAGERMAIRERLEKE